MLALRLPACLYVTPVYCLPVCHTGVLPACMSHRCTACLYVTPVYGARSGLSPAAQALMPRQSAPLHHHHPPAPSTHTNHTNPAATGPSLPLTLMPSPPPPPQVKLEQDLALKELEAQAAKVFRANPVPAAVTQPRFAAIMEAQEARRRDNHARSAALLASQERPFSFYGRWALAAVWRGRWRCGGRWCPCVVAIERHGRQTCLAACAYHQALHPHASLPCSHIPGA
jgi:hypothetical protein